MQRELTKGMQSYLRKSTVKRRPQTLREIHRDLVEEAVCNI